MTQCPSQDFVTGLSRQKEIRIIGPAPHPVNSRASSFRSPTSFPIYSVEQELPFWGDFVPPAPDRLRTPTPRLVKLATFP